MITVVTSGSRYTDIDAFACAVALAEALRVSGRPAVAWLPGPPNLTVLPRFHQHPSFLCHCPSQVLDVILVDLSDPEHLPKGLQLSQVTEVYDHHFGFETFWSESQARALIEPIGAAATLIWEESVSLRATHSLSIDALTALACAIVSNTAAFRLPLTTQRDRHALEAVEALLRLPPTWRDRYLDEIDRMILADLDSAIATDTKLVRLLHGVFISVGQVEIDDGAKAIDGLLKLAETKALPDIVIVAARGIRQTSIVTCRADLAERIAAHYESNVIKLGCVYTIKLEQFLLRKMILPELDAIIQ